MPIFYLFTRSDLSIIVLLITITAGLSAGAIDRAEKDPKVVLSGKKGKQYRLQQQREQEALTSGHKINNHVPTRQQKGGGSSGGGGTSSLAAGNSWSAARAFQQQKLFANYCYSCMNAEFYEYWPFLQQTYVKPANFTDLCLNMPSYASIGFVHCETACVVIKEQRMSGGTPDGFNIVRGCLATVTRYQLPSYVYTLSRRYGQINAANHGKQFCQKVDTKHLYMNWRQGRDSNSRIIRKRRSTSRRYSRTNADASSSLFDSRRSTTANGGGGPEFSVQVCTCNGHLCNRALRLHSTLPNSFGLFYIILGLKLLIIVSL